MLPPLGCGGGNKAECRDAGLLDDERARQRLCLPWVAWEEGNLGGEPGLSSWTAPGERKQPGLCRGWQHGIFFPLPRSMLNPSSLIRGQNRGPCSGSSETQPLGLEGSPPADVLMQGHESRRTQATCPSTVR